MTSREFASADALEHHEYEAPGREGLYAAFAGYDETPPAVATRLRADAADVALAQPTTDGINRVEARIRRLAGRLVDAPRPVRWLLAWPTA